MRYARIPTTGSNRINTIQPAFAQPDMSRRRMSPKTTMNIQMNANQKKNHHPPQHRPERPLHSDTPDLRRSAPGRSIVCCRPGGRRHLRRVKSVPRRVSGMIHWRAGRRTRRGRRRHPAGPAARRPLPGRGPISVTSRRHGRSYLPGVRFLRGAYRPLPAWHVVSFAHRRVVPLRPITEDLRLGLARRIRLCSRAWTRTGCPHLLEARWRPDGRSGPCCQYGTGE